MVLLCIKIDLKDNDFGGDLIWLDEFLVSLKSQDGYCGHNIKRDINHQEKLLLVVEWTNDVALKRCLQKEEFKLFREKIKAIVEKFTSSMAWVLTYGEIRLVMDRIVLPLAEQT